MGAIMKKTLMLSVALLIGAQAAQPLVASAEGMYQDIVQNAINDSLRNPAYANSVQLHSIEEALVRVDHLRENAQAGLISSHDYMNSGIVTYLRGLDGFLGVAAILAGINDYVRLNKPIEHAAVGLLLGALGLSCYCMDKIDQYAIRKQIKQYNEVIAKLELKKAELKKKMRIEAAVQLINVIDMN